MVNTFIFRNLRIVTFSILLFIAFTASSQTSKTPSKPSLVYGVPDNVWKTYLNKTNLFLEKVDEKSFLNYIFFANDGDFADMDYFTKYISGKLNKDKAELVFKVGTGKITTVAEVKAFYAALQPVYTTYFLDFQKRKAQIIETENSLRAPITGTPTPLNCGSPCTNPGFESGTGFWDYYTGTACASSTSDPCSITAGYSIVQHVIQTVGGFDPVVGAALPVVPPGGGSSSLMLGDGPTTGGYAARASISFTVSAANANFTYRYACVLQDPGTSHTDPERPYFNVHLRDGAGNLITCGEYMVMAKPPVVGFTETSPGSTIWYRNWTTVFVPLSSYIGQCVTVQFTSSDCSQGGHYGYAYIDGDCDPLTLLSSSPSVCGGSSVILTAPAGGASYAWTNTAGGTTGIVGSTTGQTCTVNIGGTYQCVITSAAGPSCTTTLNLTVGSAPASPVASFTNTTVCAGLATAFTDTSTPVGSISAWAWDFNGDGITDSNLQNPSYTFATAGTYPVTLIATWGACNSTITQNVTVNAGTLPTITPAGPFCATAPSVNLVGTPAGGTWSGTGITNAAAGTFNPASATVGNNTITYTVVTGCGGSVTATVVVNPSPVSNAGPDVSFCSGGTGNLGATTTAGQTYSWTAATGLSSSIISNPTVSLTIGGVAPITSTYIVTTTVAATGCLSTDPVNVTVNPLPVLVITDPAAVCSPNTIDITALTITTGSSIAGSILTYWNDAAATSSVITPAAIAASGTYYIQANAGGGCTDIQPVVVTINPLPVSDAGPDVTICTGGIGNMGAAAVAGNTYLWSPVAGLSSTTVSNPTVTLINGGTASITTAYTVTTTNTLSGCQSTDIVNVTVDAVATANAGSAQSVCIGSTLTLGGAVGGSATGGTWSGGTGTYAPNNTTLNAVYTPSAAEYAAGSITLTLTTNDPTGPCTFASSNVTFSFYQTPVVNFSVDDPDGCPVHCANFTDLSTVGGGDNVTGWLWDFGDGATSNIQNPSHCYPNTGLYDVTLTVTSNHSCTNTMTIVHMIQVFAVPVAEFNPTPNPATVLNPVITLNDQSSPDVVYWYYSFGDGDTCAPTTPSPVHSYPNEVSGSYMATLTVHNADGCIATVQHEIFIGPEFTFFIPNAFTPNGDGVNDFFFGAGIGIEKFDLFIFDRWGNEIFHGHDLSDMWNGKANGGSDAAQQDVYVWKVKLTDVFGKKHNYIGTVTLVK